MIMLPANMEIVRNFFDKNKNYIIEYSDTGEFCIIYFSSNGIYFPNDEKTFKSEIIEKNRYEWYNTRIKNARKHIFVRDIYKQWYVNGINRKLDGVESLLAFLKTETAGCKIITIGSSSGGYAAALFGCLLNATAVFAFSAQFSLFFLLHDENERVKNPLIVKYSICEDKSKYYDLTELIKDSNLPVFYFFPIGSGEDVEQHELISEIENVYAFRIVDDVHGVPITYASLSATINSDVRKLFKLNQKFRNKHISPEQYEIAIIGIGKWYFLKNIYLIKRKVGNMLNYYSRLKQYIKRYVPSC